MVDPLDMDGRNYVEARITTYNMDDETVDVTYENGEKECLISMVDVKPPASTTDSMLM